MCGSAQRICIEKCESAKLPIVLSTCWAPKYNNNNSKNKQNIKEGFVAVASALMADVTDGNWYLDSGASNHMCTEKSIFTKIVANNTLVHVGNKDLV